MKRFRVRPGESPREFLQRVFGDMEPTWAMVQAGYRIFREDGGTLTWEEWLKFFPGYNAPVEDINWIQGRKGPWGEIKRG